MKIVRMTTAYIEDGGRDASFETCFSMPKAVWHLNRNRDGGSKP